MIFDEINIIEDSRRYSNATSFDTSDYLFLSDSGILSIANFFICGVIGRLVKFHLYADSPYLQTDDTSSGVYCISNGVVRIMAQMGVVDCIYRMGNCVLRRAAVHQFAEFAHMQFCSNGDNADQRCGSG